MSLVGYARVSTLDQDTALQQDALKRQAAARARGKVWGRPRSMADEDVAQIVVMWRSGAYLQRELADMWGVSLSCLRDSIHRFENRGRWRQ